MTALNLLGKQNVEDLERAKISAVSIDVSLAGMFVLLFE